MGNWSGGSWAKDLAWVVTSYLGRGGYAMTGVTSPKTDRSRPDLPMKRNRCGKSSGSDNSLVSEVASRPAACIIVRRAFWWAGQRMRKWCTVSLKRRQQGQMGDSALEMRCRCLLRGMWPVCNWMSRLACFLGSGATSFLNLVEGRVGSMLLIHVYRGDVCHTRCAASFNFF
jgi:hypothetical protein